VEKHNLTSYLPKFLLVLKDYTCASDSNPIVIKRIKNQEAQYSSIVLFLLA
jgi:hypothetical protein